MTQTAYPQPGGCQLCLPLPLPAETTTGCGIRMHWEALSFPTPCCSWVLRRGLERGLGSPATADPAPRVASWLARGPVFQGCPSVKHTSAFCSFSSGKAHRFCAGCQVSAKYPGRFCRVFQAARGGGGGSERMFVLRNEREAIFGCKRIWGWADW